MVVRLETIVLSLLAPRVEVVAFNFAGGLHCSVPTVPRLGGFIGWLRRQNDLHRLADQRLQLRQVESFGFDLLANADGVHGNDDLHSCHESHSSHQPAPTPTPPPPDPARLIPPRGDYQTLLSFQKAVVIYGIPFRFAHKFLSKGDRTIDQMIQSARSGKQNILEGSKAGTTSKETEITLTNVGRASLEELLADYRDYLRVRDLRQWDKNSKEALFVRDQGRQTPQSFELYRGFVETRPAEVIANTVICLIHQTNYLLDQQLKTLEKEFHEQGGLRERMTKARLNYRNQQQEGRS